MTVGGAAAHLGASFNSQDSYVLDSQGQGSQRPSQTPSGDRGLVGEVQAKEREGQTAGGGTGNGQTPIGRLTDFDGK